MVYAEHEADWPDKMMFAAMLVLLAGILGTVFEVAVMGGVEVGAEGLAVLEFMPNWLTLTLSAVAIILAILGIRHQAWGPTLGGAVAAFASMGFLLLSSALAVLAVPFILKSFIEREETHWDEHTVGAELWPDKALAASMMMTVAGLVTLVHAVYLYAGSTEPLYATSAAWVQATVNLLLSFFLFWAARQVFHLTQAGLARIACVGAFLGAGFYFLGPVLGITAFVLLGLAEKEDEFVDA